MVFREIFLRIVANLCRLLQFFAGREYVILAITLTLQVSYCCIMGYAMDPDQHAGSFWVCNSLWHQSSLEVSFFFHSHQTLILMLCRSYLETGGKDAVVRPWVWIAWFFVGPAIGSIAFQWYIFIAVRPIPVDTDYNLTTRKRLEPSSGQRVLLLNLFSIMLYASG